MAEVSVSVFQVFGVTTINNVDIADTQIHMKIGSLDVERVKQIEARIRAAV
jgi:hypothetical protein